ncbi:MAG: cyclase family protein [Chitinivibrionales bacterium]|nr:cyclase family protein [Chitinivibrionales bacterium]
MHIVDLSHTIEPAMPVFPGTESPNFQIPYTLEKHGFQETRLTLLSHIGTHLDAAAHLIPGGKTLDSYPLEYFYGNCCVIDATDHSCAVIHKKHIESLQPIIQHSSIVLLKTGWSTFWGKDDYFGTYPTLGEEAAFWLSEQGVRIIGVDTISIDPINSKTLPVHRIILEKGMLIIENLTNLSQLPPHSFSIACFPLKVSAIDGFSVRVVALISP